MANKLREKLLYKNEKNVFKKIQNLESVVTNLHISSYDIALEVLVCALIIVFKEFQ